MIQKNSEKQGNGETAEWDPVLDPLDAVVLDVEQSGSQPSDLRRRFPHENPASALLHPTGIDHIPTAGLRSRFRSSARVQFPE